MPRRTVTGVAAPALAALTLGLLSAGCGHQSSQRSAVANYLKQVNRVEQALTGPLTAVSSIGRQFARESRTGGSLTTLVSASHEQQLRRALSQIETQRVRLAGPAAPPPAKRLRSVLLQIVDREAELTRELAQLIAFLPGYSAALRPLAPTTRKLEAALSRRTAFGPSDVATVYASKAAALRKFKAVVDRALHQIQRLRPPRVQQPVYRSELASLGGMSTAAARLADSLQTGPQGNVQALLAEFNRAAALNQTLGVQKAQIAAIRAYDQQVVSLGTLGQEADRERLRLATELK